mmetsp:Transcript_18687/g.44310  ORF Transcript_18687/g.44310 Transcript_18687/m.44310 type:complete len:193 (-) Transcript_18687:93-671(-)
MASCTSPALVHTSQVADGWDAEKSQSLVHTPSTACPTPRTPVSRNLLPPLALPEPITYSREAQPFWWPMSEGDEGALSSPLNEPSMGMQGDCRFGEDSRAFGCLGLPQWVYEGDADSDSDWDTPGDSQGGSESPALSCFESRAPVQRKPVCWADLAEEEEMEIKMTSQAKTRPKVSWADLQEDSEEPSWTWN